MFLCELATNMSKLIGKQLFLRTWPIFDLQRLPTESRNILRMITIFIINWWLMTWPRCNWGCWYVKLLVRLSHLDLRNVLKKLIISAAYCSVDLGREWSFVLFIFLVFKHESVLSSWRHKCAHLTRCCIFRWINKRHSWKHRVINWNHLILIDISVAHLWVRFFTASRDILVSSIGKSAFRSLLILYYLMQVTCVCRQPILRMLIPL